MGVVLLAGSAVVVLYRIVHTGALAEWRGPAVAAGAGAGISLLVPAAVGEVVGHVLPGCLVSRMCATFLQRARLSLAPLVVGSACPFPSWRSAWRVLEWWRWVRSIRWKQTPSSLALG